MAFPACGWMNLWLSYYFLTADYRSITKHCTVLFSRFYVLIGLSTETNRVTSSSILARAV
jgi:hypothetical protein